MEVRNFRPLKIFRINGMVLWPFVFYADKEPPPFVRNHESIHVEQIRRTGVLRFYAQYLREYFRGRMDGLNHDEAYRNISFEREAYQNQYDLFYLTNRQDGHTSPTNNRSRGQS